MNQKENFIHAQVLDCLGGMRSVLNEDTGKPHSEGTVLWLHMDYREDRARNWLRKESGLNPLVVEALIAEDTRPRALAFENGLLIILRGVNLNPGAEPDDMISLRMWFEPGRIITTRMRDLLSVKDVIDTLKKGSGPRGEGEFLIAIIDRLVWRMSDTVDNLEDLVDEIEDQILESTSSDSRQSLIVLRRQVITLRRFLAPQREAFARLYSEKISWFDDRNRFFLREIQDRLTRHVEDLDAVRERATITQEEILSRLSDQLNRRMYVLSIIAAIFLPLGFLTGLLGINVAGIPGANNPIAFVIFVVFLMIIVTIQLLVFKWRKWF